MTCAFFCMYVILHQKSLFYKISHLLWKAFPDHPRLLTLSHVSLISLSSWHCDYLKLACLGWRLFLSPSLEYKHKERTRTTSVLLHVISLVSTERLVKTHQGRKGGREEERKGGREGKKEEERKGKLSPALLWIICILRLSLNDGWRHLFLWVTYTRDSQGLEATMQSGPWKIIRFFYSWWISKDPALESFSSRIPWGLGDLPKLPIFG